MIIAIDASKTALKQKTGIDNTAYQIILGLKKIDHKNSYFLYTNKPLPKELISSNFQEKLIPFPRLWNKFRLPLALMRDKPDIFLELTTSIPSFAPKNTAVLIHDLAFKFFPKAYSSFELMLQESAIKIAINKSKRIIFTSKANRDDFLKFYEYKKDQIKIIPLGYDEKTYRSVSSPKDVLKINFPYFLSVGRLEARKNIVRLLEAFQLFKEKNKTDHKLVLVGKKGYGFKDIKNKVNSDPVLKENVIFAGYISDDNLAHLYNRALAFVFPGLYEGFGLPILEAFACKTPVVTSNIGTLKEVAGDAAVFVDPLDAKSICTGLTKISTDKTLRVNLINKGVKRTEEYTWDKTAKSFLNMIEEI